MAKHQACHGCMDGCTRESAVHCTSCVNEPWPCDATVLRAERDEAVAAMRRNILDLNQGAALVNARADQAEAEAKRLRLALDTAAGRLGHLSTVLSLSNKPTNAKGALEWSEEARAALGECPT